MADVETRPITDCTGQWRRSGVVGWMEHHPGEGGWRACPVHKDGKSLVVDTHKTPPQKPYVVGPGVKPALLKKGASVEGEKRKVVKVKAKGRKKK